ncbi:hypothetical protein CDD81_7633 [Ophiocordyceps australis]|uniref:MICOS complex subunit n=1 Tax=Ophiocordyceps australis TaxID=1399860 RepID=A0A2C5X8Y2_9HYPO|nr:hypothetical protein CDD81_7633 [Ophiocordyceps australis]
MAARVLLQRRSVALLAVGGLALYPTSVIAEAPAHQRKPIYDDFDTLSARSVAPPSAPKQAPEAQQVAPSASSNSKTDVDAALAPQPSRGPTPTDRLAVQIGRVRLFLHDCAAAAEDRVNGAMDAAFNMEHSFTTTIASLAPPRESGEKLMPGVIYVLVAAMAGSVVTRNRGFLLRTTVPLAFGVGAGWLLLPITMRNVANLSWSYEKHFPAIADAHLRLREGIDQSLSFAKTRSQAGKRYVDEKVTDAREAVEGWVKQGK